MRWNKNDSLRLTKAINKYNRIIAKNKSMLPKANYNTIRDKLLTRKELEKVIRELSSVSSKKLNTLVNLGGKQITQYEYENIMENKKRAIISLRALQRKVQKISDSRGFVFSSEAMTIEKNIKGLDLKGKTGKTLEKTLERIDRNAGSREYRSKLNYQKYYMNNILPALEGYSGYELLEKSLKDLKNPYAFYDFISQSEILTDISKIINDSEDEERIKEEVKGQLSTMSMNDEEAFKYALYSELGLDERDYI